MKRTVKLTESELTSIIENIIKEDLRIGKTVEPDERNIGQALNVKSKPHIVTPDPEMERKVVIQNVVDRIMKYGRNYIKGLEKLNDNYPLGADKYDIYSTPTDDYEDMGQGRLGENIRKRKH